LDFISDARPHPGVGAVADSDPAAALLVGGVPLEGELLIVPHLLQLLGHHPHLRVVLIPQHVHPPLLVLLLLFGLLLLEEVGGLLLLGLELLVQLVAAVLHLLLAAVLHVLVLVHVPIHLLHPAFLLARLKHLHKIEKRSVRIY